jgi:hypothetical protein
VLVAGFGFDSPVCRCETDEFVELWVGSMAEPIDPRRPVMVRISAAADGNLAALLTREEAVTLAKVLLLLASRDDEEVTVQ